MQVDVRLQKLLAWLIAHPAILTNDTQSGGIGCEYLNDGSWWVKFAIDVTHPAAWTTVQVMGYTLNYLSLGDRLGTVFKPVSPPPYLNGGPEDYLSWVIEAEPGTTADLVTEWLEAESDWQS